MIETSQAYKLMMQGAVVRSRMEIRISYGNESVLLTDKDIVLGTFSINRRSSNNREFSFGTCYSASCSFSSFVTVESEIEGNYLTVVPTIFYDIGNGNEEQIPLGVFRCDSPKVFSKTTSYECYDFMLAFDQPIETRISGLPYNVIDYICRKCGVENGNTSLTIGAMINSSQTVTIDPDQIVTYRDALSLISILLGGYCVMDRNGRFVVREFHKTPDMTLLKKRRTSHSFGGYKTMFCGVKCRFLANQNFYPYYAVDETDGLILDLGDIPIIEASDDTKNAILGNIKTHLEGYEYYPCEIGMVGDPSIEEGDMISTVDRHGYLKNILLTSVTFTWRAESQIMSEGANPKLQAVSTVEKRAMAREDQLSKAANIVTTTYVNAAALTVTDDEQTLVSHLRFITTKDLTAIFGAEIPVYSDGDGYIEIEYSNAGIVGDVVKARLHEGYNLITLANHIYYPSNTIVNLLLRARTEGIGAGTAPTVTIDQNTIRSYVFAQGIESEAPWDGIITIVETVPFVTTTTEFLEITDDVEITTYLPVSPELASMVEALVPQMQRIPVSDTMNLILLYHDDVNYCGENFYAGTDGVLL